MTLPRLFTYWFDGLVGARRASVARYCLEKLPNELAVETIVVWLTTHQNSDCVIELLSVALFEWERSLSTRKDG